MPNTGNTGPDPGDSNSTAVTQTGVVEVYGDPSDGGVPTWNATTGRFEWGTGGSGTSSALSATKLAGWFDFAPSEGATVSLAPDTSSVNFTGATVLSGGDFWATDTALPLALTVDPPGILLLPDDDAVYDITMELEVTCNAADEGKMVGFEWYCNDMGKAQAWSPVVNGVAEAILVGVAYVFAGDGPTRMNVVIYPGALTVVATITGMNNFIVSKR